MSPFRVGNTGPSRDPEPTFLGVGWNFPLAVAADGTIAVAEYEEDVRQSIRIILGTNRGERVMRPDFGAGLHDYLFAPVSATTMALVKTRVTEALTDWEPRIELLAVDVSTDPAQRNTLQIEVSYRVRATNTLANLVYPFYLEEGPSA